jgi:beta-alanine degradation protein BauB
MKTLLAGALLLASALTFGQDPVRSDPRHHRVIFENDQVRLILVTLAPGEQSPMLEYGNAMILTLHDHKERVTSDLGVVGELNAKAGEFLSSNGKHITANIGDQLSQVLIMEFNTPEARKAASASSLRGLTRITASESNETQAVATLRTYNTAEVTYASTYNLGFTDGLRRLGPPLAGRQPNQDHADLVNPLMAGMTAGGTDRSIVKDGYRFTYTPAAVAFGMMPTYTITAVPVDFGVSGKRSFFTDQSAVVRSTLENRPATARDNPF